MRVLQAILFFFTAVEGFAPLAFVGRIQKAALPMTSDTHQSKDFTASSGIDVNHIPVLINNLTAENFDESLEMLEPLLTNECVGDICNDYMTELKEKAKEIGKEVPAGYAPSHH